MAASVSPPGTAQDVERLLHATASAGRWDRAVRLLLGSINARMVPTAGSYRAVLGALATRAPPTTALATVAAMGGGHLSQPALYRTLVHAAVPGHPRRAWEFADAASKIGVRLGDAVLADLAEGLVRVGAPTAALEVPRLLHVEGAGVQQRMLLTLLRACAALRGGAWEHAAMVFTRLHGQQQAPPQGSGELLAESLGGPQWALGLRAFVSLPLEERQAGPTLSAMADLLQRGGHWRAAADIVAKQLAGVMGYRDARTEGITDAHAAHIGWVAACRLILSRATVTANTAAVVIERLPPGHWATAARLVAACSRRGTPSALPASALHSLEGAPWRVAVAVAAAAPEGLAASTAEALLATGAIPPSVLPTVVAAHPQLAAGAAAARALSAAGRVDVMCSALGRDGAVRALDSAGLWTVALRTALCDGPGPHSPSPPTERIIVRQRLWAAALAYALRGPDTATLLRDVAVPVCALCGQWPSVAAALRHAGGATSGLEVVLLREAKQRACADAARKLLQEGAPLDAAASVLRFAAEGDALALGAALVDELCIALLNASAPLPAFEIADRTASAGVASTLRQATAGVLPKPLTASCAAAALIHRWAVPTMPATGEELLGMLDVVRAGDDSQGIAASASFAEAVAYHFDMMPPALAVRGLRSVLLMPRPRTARIAQAALRAVPSGLTWVEALELVGTCDVDATTAETFVGPAVPWEASLRLLARPAIAAVSPAAAVLCGEQGLWQQCLELLRAHPQAAAAVPALYLEASRRATVERLAVPTASTAPGVVALLAEGQWEAAMHSFVRLRVVPEGLRGQVLRGAAAHSWWGALQIIASAPEGSVEERDAEAAVRAIARGAPLLEGARLLYWMSARLPVRDAHIAMLTRAVAPPAGPAADETARLLKAVSQATHRRLMVDSLLGWLELGGLAVAPPAETVPPTAPHKSTDRVVWTEEMKGRVAACVPVLAEAPAAWFLPADTDPRMGPFALVASTVLQGAVSARDVHRLWYRNEGGQRRHLERLFARTDRRGKTAAVSAALLSEHLPTIRFGPPAEVAAVCQSAFGGLPQATVRQRAFADWAAIRAYVQRHPHVTETTVVALWPALLARLTDLGASDLSSPSTWRAVSHWLFHGTVSSRRVGEFLTAHATEIRAAADGRWPRAAEAELAERQREGALRPAALDALPELSAADIHAYIDRYHGVYAQKGSFFPTDVEAVAACPDLSPALLLGSHSASDVALVQRSQRAIDDAFHCGLRASTATSQLLPPTQDAVVPRREGGPADAHLVALRRVVAAEHHHSGYVSRRSASVLLQAAGDRWAPALEWLRARGCTMPWREALTVATSEPKAQTTQEPEWLRELSAHATVRAACSLLLLGVAKAAASTALAEEVEALSRRDGREAARIWRHLVAAGIPDRVAPAQRERCIRCVVGITVT